MNRFSLLLAAFIAIGSLIACSTYDKHEPVVVSNFDQQKYLGVWYEIARLDYKWEKDLNNVTATYSLKENGDIKVDNRGYNTRKEKWEESVGKAEAVGEPTVGKLKVSFFGPFYSDYNIVALDDDYQYSLVAGESTEYLWFLSRQKTMPQHVKNEFLEKAKSLGYDTGKLVWVKHN